MVEYWFYRYPVQVGQFSSKKWLLKNKGVNCMKSIGLHVLSKNCQISLKKRWFVKHIGGDM